MDARYDYVIVGGGSAGCVLANRLSADPAVRVCLVEAGPADRNPFIRVPMGILPLVRGWFCNWRFWSEPQAELHGRRLYQPRGKVLGGSSSINAAVCTRGHRDDYDHWAAGGCEGWAYDEVLPYFRRSETFTAPVSEGDRAYHGFEGPLQVARRRHDNPVSLAFVEAARQAGLPANADFNGAEQEGVGAFHVFQTGGERCSNARAYLDPVRGRPNLEILTGAQATRILFRDRRAVGVRIFRDRRYRDLLAVREVVLCAGAFQSPQLLMLSGIGPRDDLQRHGIEALVDLPGVGQNLQDHLDVFVEVRSRSRAPLSFQLRDWPRLLRATWQYLTRRQGEFTSNAAETGGFVRSQPQESIPDLQWHFIPAPNGRHGFDLRGVMTRYGYCVMNYDLRPQSRGHVGLHSADPFAPPLIDPCYATAARDLDRLVRGIRRIREVLQQPALREYHGEEIAPGPQLLSDEELRDYVRRSAEIAYHPVGTCKMGRDDDPLAVLDPQLRVRGIDGLRVADASVMPTLVGSNTNAPVTMIAEKAADLIRGVASPATTPADRRQREPAPA